MHGGWSTGHAVQPVDQFGVLGGEVISGVVVRERPQHDPAVGRPMLIR
jgi:hypothetical protein